MWECKLTVRDSCDGIHEHTGFGDTPSSARDTALWEAAKFANEREYTFVILEERYA